MMISDRCARYPYEVLVFYLVVSIGLWSLPNATGRIYLADLKPENDQEFGSMIVVARCLAVLHIFYQTKKLKLFKSAWLFLAHIIIWSLVTLSLSVLSRVLASGLSDSRITWTCLLPIMLLVTELDFSHALLLTSVKNSFHTESVPASIATTMGKLAKRAFTTSFIDLVCLSSVLVYNSPLTEKSGLNLAIGLCIYSIIFNLIIFVTLIPSTVGLIIYWFPSAPLRQIADESDTVILTSRALNGLKFGSGFEVFALLSSTFILSQSKRIFGILLRRYCPNTVVLLAREYISPFFPNTFSFSQTGLVTFLLVSLFRYLILDNIRKNRRKAITEKPIEILQDINNDTLFDFDDEDEIRPLDELKKLLKSSKCDLMSNAEILLLVKVGIIRPYALEKVLADPERGVLIRRRFLNKPVFKSVPYEGYDFSVASRACCENIIGYVPIPVGMVGPLLVNNEEVFPMMATTEGALLASVNRGCKVIKQAGGTITSLFKNEMSRAPCLSFDSAAQSLQCAQWIKDPYNFSILKEAFESTTRFGKLVNLSTHPAGRLLYVRFGAETGDAMGMNMVSKGCEATLKIILQNFPTSRVESISGNACTDKKPSAMNWINGRGKSIIAECKIDEEILLSNFKCTAQELADLNVKKNLIGSCVAGSIGGFNAHAANVVAACFIASGQDAAQVVEGSQTMTLLEVRKRSDETVYLHASVTMMSLEVAAIGGGTNLEPQKSILNSMLGKCDDLAPGEKACKLAAVIASTVLAGELSLMSSLRKGDLVQSHLKLNRISAKPQPETKDHKIL